MSAKIYSWSVFCHQQSPSWIPLFEYVPDKFHQPVVYMIIDVKEFVSETFFLPFKSLFWKRIFCYIFYFRKCFFWNITSFWAVEMWKILFRKWFFFCPGKSLFGKGFFFGRWTVGREKGLFFAVYFFSKTFFWIFFSAVRTTWKFRKHIIWPSLFWKRFFAVSYFFFPEKTLGVIFDERVGADDSRNDFLGVDKNAINFLYIPPFYLYHHFS